MASWNSPSSASRSSSRPCTRTSPALDLRGCGYLVGLNHKRGRLTVALPYDSAAKFQEYAHPEMIVSTEWVAEHLDDPGLVVAESDEDVLLYETGHVPGAVKLDWHTELNDPVTRDYVDGAAFARLMSDKGITRDTTLVLYGDKNNWWAAYALWVCSLFGHPDVRLMDGGRAKWIAEGRPLTTDVPSRPQTDYPVIERDDKEIRAFQDQVLAHLGQPLVDVRSPGEYTGELLHMPDYPQEGALRGGHIPGAKSIPWARAAAEDATFRARAELEAIYRDGAGLGPDDDIVVYCRIGERSSHTWFVLHHLLGYPHVRNYDGSWTEWGNSVRVPITRGDRPRPLTPSIRGCRRSSTTSTPCRAGTGSSCCWSTPRSCRPCPTGTPRIPGSWSRCRNARRRCSSPSRSTRRRSFTCSSRRLPKRRPRGALPASCTRVWTGLTLRRSWPPRPSSPASSAWLTW